MPRSSPKKGKRKKRLKRLLARSIQLVDAKGKTRILLEAGDGDGFASIGLFGENQHYIQISTAPDGGLAISLFGKSGARSVTLGLSSEDDGGLVISHAEGGLGTILGAIPFAGDHQHHLDLLDGDKLRWTTRDRSQKSETTAQP